ncbi:MAG: hypothetical protein WAL08_03410 [Candidatus Sulfotelmatobacter sp.]
MGIRSLQAAGAFGLVSLLTFVGCSGSSTPSGPTISSVSISPTVVSLQVSQSEQFTAEVTGTGTFDSSVQWFVNDVAGGNSSVGTVVAGLYTAPAQVPNPSTVTIKAVATADSTKSARAQATIRAILTPTVVWNETNLSLVGGDDGEVFDSEIPPGIGVSDDGAGGAYVVWEHRFPVEILAQHLDASGQPTWAAGGILVTNPWTGYQAMPRVVSDGAGGVIVVWLDGRAGSCDESSMAECDIYGQRLDSAGALLWGSAGIPVSTTANNQGVNGLAMVSDAAGGAIVAFSDSRAGEGLTVYAQRIDTSGNPVWPANGVLFGQQPNANDTPDIAQVELISDGSGGAIGGWYFTSYIAPSTISLRTQRISASGQLMWGSSPVAVPGVSASDPNGTGVQTFGMTTDSSGGAIIVASWQPQSATVPVVLAQRISSTGSIAWSQSGMEVSDSTNADLNPAVLSDGSGGVFAAWQDCPNLGSNCHIAMQYLDSSGQANWGAGQILITQEPNQQLAPTLQPNGTGGALVTWTDCRNYPTANSCYANSDVYAQDVDASGNSLWQLNGYPLLVDPGNQGEQYYVYTPAPATVSVRLQSGDIFLAWPDGRDNVCFTTNAASACEVFVERFSF